MSGLAYTLDAETGCWNWARGRDRDGYGKIKVYGRSLRAHRHAWECAKGPIPEGGILCHRCDNPACVNVEHLFVGSHQDNHSDRSRKGRTASGERHGRAKLTAQQVAEIRETKPGHRVASERYGIGKTHYHRILRGQAWSEINVL